MTDLTREQIEEIDTPAPLVKTVSAEEMATIQRVTDEEAEPTQALRDLMNQPAPPSDDVVEKAQKKICNEIEEIKAECERQLNKEGYVDSPGGLEHMGDVWTQIQVWGGELETARAALAAYEKGPQSS